MLIYTIQLYNIYLLYINVMYYILLCINISYYYILLNNIENLIYNIN